MFFQVQSLSSDYAHIRNDNETLRELLKEETKRKQIAESSYKMLCDDKGGYWGWLLNKLSLILGKLV
ncbi:hypothetical protein DPMN_092351 [Dreissena polymorpha]|uniref:Uncharacterized protein n=1 Tax=Dreissena polymorpha TaxID=45954 RepID=A0A9D4R0X2_DREPO|nr:hypothetical protein DPMN_092351 [Dreissena polymorpha]